MLFLFVKISAFTRLIFSVFFLPCEVEWTLSLFLLFFLSRCCHTTEVNAPAHSPVFPKLTAGQFVTEWINFRPAMRGIHLSSVDSPHKRSVKWELNNSFAVSLNNLSLMCNPNLSTVVAIIIIIIVIVIVTIIISIEFCKLCGSCPFLLPCCERIDQPPRN